MTYLEAKDICLAAGRRYYQLLHHAKQVRQNPTNFTAGYYLSVTQELKQARKHYTNARKQVLDTLRKPIP